MINRLSNLKKLFLTAALPTLKYRPSEDYDTNTKTGQKLAEEEKKKKESETGWTRLYNIFSVDEYGSLSPELINILGMMMVSSVMGGILGGVMSGKDAFLNFVERNDATTFQNHLDAKRRLQDSVALGFGKGAWRWGWRLTLFTGCYSTTATAISVYRGKEGLLEHVIGGGLTGSLYKVNLGVRGVVVGGCLGTFLGMCSGVMIWGFSKLTGMSMHDVKNQTNKIHQKRAGYWETLIKQGVSQDELDIIRELDDRTGHIVPTLDSIPVEETDKKA